MNKIINKFLLAGNKLTPEVCSAYGPFFKNKERIKKFIKLEIQILFIKMNLIKLLFSMIWLMENQKI